VLEPFQLWEVVSASWVGKVIYQGKKKKRTKIKRRKSDPYTSGFTPVLSYKKRAYT